MRKFGTDAPELFQFQLEGSDEVYAIPLLGSMPLSVSMLLVDAEKAPTPEARQSATFEAEVAIVRRYCGEDVLDSISSATVGEIVSAWLEASGVEGATAGES